MVAPQANATFAMVDRINEYAEKWLNVSAQIRAYLLRNTTEHNLQSIREVRVIRGVESVRLRDHQHEKMRGCECGWSGKMCEWR